MLGKEAALFVPSGTFGNQLALFTWCPRGSEVILGEQCHIIEHEAGAASVIAGVQTRPIHAPDGVLTKAEIQKRLRKRELHAPATSLICMENAHSLGKAVPLAAMDSAYTLTREWGLPLHLDGARIFNAAIALGTDARDIARRSDSVMFCLSKGLCAPVGSLLAGTKTFVDEARLKRKVMGGGMRQAGIIAAAGIVALTKMAARLGEDHENAKRLARGLQSIAGLRVDTDSLDINMVFFTSDKVRSAEDSEKVVSRFRDEGILINGADSGQFRFVTHYWIGDKDIDRIIEASIRVWGLGFGV
jgi:threonine aldolase